MSRIEERLRESRPAAIAPGEHRHELARPLRERTACGAGFQPAWTLPAYLLATGATCCALAATLFLLGQIRTVRPPVDPVAREIVRSLGGAGSGRLRGRKVESLPPLRPAEVRDRIAALSEGKLLLGGFMD